VFIFFIKFFFIFFFWLGGGGVISQHKASSLWSNSSKDACSLVSIRDSYLKGYSKNDFGHFYMCYRYLSFMIVRGNLASVVLNLFVFNEKRLILYITHIYIIFWFLKFPSISQYVYNLCKLLEPLYM